MPSVLMNFGRYGDGYNCHFIEGDAKTLIGPRTRYFRFTTLEELDAFFRRCHPVDPTELLRKIAQWNCGSAWYNLTDEQYHRLEHASRHHKVPSLTHAPDPDVTERRRSSRPPECYALAMAKPRKKASPPKRTPEPPRPRIPIMGERVRRPGSDTIYEIAYISVDYRYVHLAFPRTNLEHRYVEATTLLYLDEPLVTAIRKPPVSPSDAAQIAKRVARAQRTALGHLAQELAALKKLLKSKRAPAEAADALDTLRQQSEVAWTTAAEEITRMLEK